MLGALQLTGESQLRGLNGASAPEGGFMGASPDRSLTRTTVLLIACAAIFCQLQTRPSFAQGPQQGAGFLGGWCAQGDPAKQASITSNGVFFTLTNEGGSTSTGHLQGAQQNAIVADGWQFVQGNLSPDGRRINWSNGTFWARCDNGGGGGGGGGGRYPNIDGTWYRGGDHSLACYIRQRGRNLRLTNESGATASGSFDSRRHVTTNWSGTTIGGTVVDRGDRINWDNGTFWTR